MNVYTVEQRTADFVHITLYLPRIAHAFVGRVSVVAARARVHGSDEHEGARQGGVVLGTRNGDLAVFERLAHRFERCARKLRQLVEKEHAVVSKADFSGTECRAAAYQCNNTNIRF